VRDYRARPITRLEEEEKFYTAAAARVFTVASFACCEEVSDFKRFQQRMDVVSFQEGASFFVATWANVTDLVRKFWMPLRVHSYMLATVVPPGMRPLMMTPSRTPAVSALWLLQHCRRRPLPPRLR